MDSEIRCGGDGDVEQSVVHIPQELIEIILPNLPVKSLLRFKSGSKSWRSLIESKTFIRKHFQNSQRRSVLKEFCSFFHKPINDDPLTSGSIVGCCNGINCILLNGRFFLCNPATKISLKLPTLDLPAGFDYHEIRCGFGWDEQTDAYKVFLSVNAIYGRRSGHVYSSKTKSWKKVDYGRLYDYELLVLYDCGGHHLYNVGVLASGKLYWVPQSRIDTCIIEYFDLKSEVFGKIELPFEPERGVGQWWLRERDGCLEALYYHEDDDKGDRRCKVWLNKGYDNKRRRKRRREEEQQEGQGLLDVWVMEEYGVKESWVKKSSITVPNPKFTLKYQQYVYVESLISPISDDDAEQRN